MKKFLFLSLCVASLMSCGQKQGPSEQEIQERIDAAVEAALRENATTATEEGHSQISEPAATNYENNSELSAKTGNVATLVGHYTISDDGSSWTVDINQDGSCQFHSNGKTYYGTWEKNTYYDCYKLDMSDGLHFVVNGKSEYYIGYIDLDCQWLYDDNSSFKAKNPNKRVKLNRVK